MKYKIVNLGSFKDSSPAGIEHSAFVRQYSTYVEERLFLYRNLNVRSLSPKLTFDSLIPKDSKNRNADLFRVLDLLQHAMEELLKSTDKLRRAMVQENKTTLGAFLLLLFDSRAFYRLLTDGILKLLGMCFFFLVI